MSYAKDWPLSTPTGPSLYVILLFICLLPLAPVTGTEYPNHTVPVREADREDAFPHAAKTEEAIFVLAVRHILTLLRPGLIYFLRHDPLVSALVSATPWFPDPLVSETQGHNNTHHGPREAAQTPRNGRSGKTLGSGSRITPVLASEPR